MRYIAAESRLEVYDPGMVRVDVLRMDGSKVLSCSARAVDLSDLVPGIYAARLLTSGGMRQLRFYKR